MKPGKPKARKRAPSKGSAAPRLDKTWPLQPPARAEIAREGAVPGVDAARVAGFIEAATGIRTRVVDGELISRCLERTAEADRKAAAARLATRLSCARLIDPRKPARVFHY